MSISVKQLQEKFLGSKEDLLFRFLDLEGHVGVPTMLVNWFLRKNSKESNFRTEHAHFKSFVNSNKNENNNG